MSQTPIGGHSATGATATLPPELDPRGRPSGRTPGGRTPPRRTGIIAAAIGSTMVLLVSAGGWFAVTALDAQLQRADVGLTGPRSSVADEAQTILLVGSDNREGLTKKQIKKLHLGSATADNGAGRRSDTMILMHLSKERDQVTMISLPRDSFVKIPAWTDDAGTKHKESSNKLNAAFAYGGPALTIKTIEANTGVTIDHYVEVNFQGFVSMVDALGGVEVCVKQPISDQKSGLDLPKGKSVLNGAEGLAFVRARYFDPRADIGRIERQQQFLGSMFRTATASGTLLNPAKLTAFLDASLASVTVDDRIKRDDILALAAKLKQVAAGNVTFLTVPIADYDYRDGLHGSSVRWDRQAAQELFSKIESDEAVVPVVTAGADDTARATVAPGQIKVQVLNGAGITGLARTAANDLAGVGFAIAAPPANAATAGATRTIIAYDPAYNESVKTLAAALPGAELRAVPSQGPVMQVILGSDYTKAVAPTVSAPNPSGAGDKNVTAAKAGRCR